MKCPACPSKRISAIELAGNLRASKCEVCEGIWISHENYSAWHASFSEPQPEKTFSEVDLDLEDKPGAKVCPDCGRILLKYRVGHGLNFFVDHCSACGGIWLDKNEWEALEAKNLHDEIHRIFSTSWQKQIREESLEETMEKVFRNRFGDQTFEKISEIRDWLNHQSEKDQLMAFLQET
jgi:Zn-finger nucleic acid-binding protein